MTSGIKTDNPYRLAFVNGLPPGTDTPEQLEECPRLPRPAPALTRPTPQWPPPEERKGKKHTNAYNSKLDPEIEYDQIIRTAMFFGGSDFGISLSYAVVFCLLTQPPSGAVAIHGGKIIRRGHQRYYDTFLVNLHWVYYGSSAPETIKYADKVNKLHSGVWKKYPGTVSAPWEAQMAVVANAYFETWLRRTVGAKNQAPHPKVQAAFPAWGERLTGHLVTEPSNGTRPMGINFPRDWDEMERFFYWFDEFPYEDQTTPEQKKKGHETSEAFIDQFCELWFPRTLKYFGRHMMLTFVPPNCRRRQALGQPNPVISAVVKLFFKIAFDLKDRFSSDPADPPLVAFREILMEKDLNVLDKQMKEKRDSQDRYLVVFFILGLITTAVYKVSTYC